MLKDVWPGNNKFWCKGKYFVGPDWCKTVLTSFVILAAAFSVMYFSCSYWNTRQRYWPMLSILGLTAVSLFFLFKTSTHDPGFIPKQTVPFATHYAQNLNEHISVTKPLSFNCRGCVIKLKFCPTCMIYRPPRCSHCSICNLCVEEFDHHCPWIGNCIGKRNYFYFILLLFSCFLLGILSLCICSYHIHLENGIWSVEVVFSVVNLALGFILMVFVGCLLGFHVYLLLRGLTTNEKIKNVWGRNGNPFDNGRIWLNFKSKLEGFRTKSQFNINAKASVYDEELNANALHRGFVVMKVNGNFCQTFEENANTVVVKREDMERTHDVVGGL